MFQKKIRGEMTSRSFTPCISTTKIRAELIAKAANRVIFCAPGISEREIQSILSVRQSRPNLSLQLLLDITPVSFTSGYWGNLTPVKIKQYQELFANSKVANNFRLGILIIDQCSWIYTPTPLGIEHEPTGEEPNALELDEIATGLLLSSLISDTDQPQSKRANIDASNLEKTHQEIVNSGFPPPDQRRRIDIIRPLLKIIQFDIRGYKLTHRRLELPREIIDIIGSSDQEINDRINAAWRMFSNEDEGEIHKLQKEIEQEIEKIKKNYLIRFGNFGFGLGLREREEFLKSWQSLENVKTPAFKRAIAERYDEMVSRSKSMLEKLLIERISSGNLQIRSQKTLFELPREEEVQLFVENTINRIKWPDNKEILRQILITYHEYDISEKLIGDPEFVRLFEKQFGRIDDIVRRATPRPAGPALDRYGFSLN